MDVNDHNFEREIEDGYARADKMLKRQQTLKVIGIVFFLSVAGFLSITGFSKHQTVSVEKTATARPLQTSTALAYQHEASTQKAQQNTAIAMTSQARSAATSQSKSTATAKAKQAQTATAHVQENFIATIQANYQLIYSLDSGVLAHGEDDFIETEWSDINVADFIVRAEFMNPYSTTTGSWDYGFLFRDEGKNSQYRLVIRSDKQWVLINNTDSSDGDIINGGWLSNLNVSSNGSNTIKLVCQERRGFLYVNDVLIDELDLSARMNSGDIGIGTGFYSGDEINGYFTNFKDFDVLGEQTKVKSPTATSTQLFSDTSSQKVVIQSYKSTRFGKAPFPVDLGAELVSANGNSLCVGSADCDYSWVAYRNGIDVASSSGSRFINTFDKDGDYTVVVTICLNGNCKSASTSIRVE